MKRLSLIFFGVILGAILPVSAQRRHPPVLPPAEGIGIERAGVRALIEAPSEGGHITPTFVLRKYLHSPKDTDPGFTLPKLHAWLAAHSPDEVLTRYGNLTTTAGANLLLTKGIGGSGQVFDSTHCCVCVGDGAGTATAGATDISATATTAHRWNQAADATYPQIATNQMTIVVTVTTSNANFAWNEWSINNHSSATLSGNEGAVLTSVTMLNWKSGAALGTKSSGTWTGTWTYSLS